LSHSNSPAPPPPTSCSPPCLPLVSSIPKTLSRAK
jgi:hypothetical protein